MNTAYFLINTVFDLYLMVILLRVWLQWARADFYNPMSQMVVKLTNPLVVPLRRIIPGFGGLDMASVLLAIIIAFAKLALLKSMNVLLADWLTLSLFAALTVLKKAGSMIFWILLIRAILSWVSQGRNPIEYVMHQLTEPFLAPIRRILPAHVENPHGAWEPGSRIHPCGSCERASVTRLTQVENEMYWGHWSSQRPQPTHIGRPRRRLKSWILCITRKRIRSPYFSRSRWPPAMSEKRSR